MKGNRQVNSRNIMPLPRVKLFVLLLFVVLFCLVSSTIGNWPLPKSPKRLPHSLSIEDNMINENGLDDHILRSGVKQMERILSKTPVPFLVPWGGDSIFVFREWMHVYRSIRHDIYNHNKNSNFKMGDMKNDKSSLSKKKIQILVYDVDDGYFTLSLTKFIPEAFVTSLVFDKCTHSVKKQETCLSPIRVMESIENKWKEIQKTNISEEDPRLFVCLSPYMNPIRLGGIAGRYILSDYQIALSLFDHFTSIPSKITFQRALVSVLNSTSIATFITLPNFPVSSIKKHSFPLHWYEEPQNPEVLIKESADAFGLQISISSIASIEFGGFNRTIFRVERQEGSIRKSDDLNGIQELNSIQCEARKELLRCSLKGELLRCPS